MPAKKLTIMSQQYLRSTGALDSSAIRKILVQFSSLTTGSTLRWMLQAEEGTASRKAPSATPGAASAVQQTAA